MDSIIAAVIVITLAAIAFRRSATMDSALINHAWVPVILAAAGLLVIALFAPKTTKERK